MYARRTSSQIINFAGHFKQTQVRSVIESTINLSVSIVLVYKIGIYGVLIGTIVALLYRTNDVIIYANWNILGRKPWKTYRRWIQNMAIMCVLNVGISAILPSIDNYLMWAINAVWVTVICCSFYFIMDSLLDLKSYHMIKSMISKGISDKLNKTI